MSWTCVKNIRRWADEDIECVGRDVLRRQAQKLADEVHAAMETLHQDWFERHKKATELLAETARRNVRAEQELNRALHIIEGWIAENCTVEDCDRFNCMTCDECDEPLMKDMCMFIKDHYNEERK